MTEEPRRIPPEAPPHVELGEPRLVVKKIWGHDDSGASGLEYLVEWETERSPTRGQWIRVLDLNADELIDAYMTALTRDGRDRRKGGSRTVASTARTTDATT